MATLNTSSNGPSITASYQKIVQAPAPSGPAASSPTYGQWALFTVQAPLVSAFQQDTGKESVLKVQTTGEGELVDLIEEFSDGRIQFAFAKVKDPNTSLPKSVLIAWCGEGVPERTKGYFTSHLNAVSKILHGYHVQVTARSDRDLSPELIVQKVADSSGSKYSGGGTLAASSKPPPPVASKPVMPTKSFGAGFQPLGSRSRQAAPSGPTDADGWGDDAPPVTRSQLEKVHSSYQPTKVDIGALRSQAPASSQRPGNKAAESTGSSNPDVVKGGYQPVGKVDIAALRRQAQEQGTVKDDRPTVVKGAYEPVGKVDIEAIRRKAQNAPMPTSSQPTADQDGPRMSLADRSSAFQQPSGHRLTSLPKPQIANRFGQSSFTGTKAPTPGGFDAKPVVPSAPVGVASRTFADEGGKTPAQLWEEKKRARGLSGAGDSHQPKPASPVQPQTSGGWQSGYGGKKWSVQMPTRTGGSSGGSPKVEHEPSSPDREAQPAAGGVSSIRDRFNGAAPMGAPGSPSPPPLDTSSKPNAGAGGVPMPGLPSRHQQPSVPAEEHQDLPPPPPLPVPKDEPEESDQEELATGSPVRIAMPVARGVDPTLEKAEEMPAQSVPTDSLEKVISQHKEPEREAQVQEENPARGAAQAAAASTFGHVEDPRGASGAHEAIAQYDYEKAEDNELELREGDRITNIDMVDEDWWMGQNPRGEVGLFPSNYVELVQATSSAPAAPPAAAPAASHAHPPSLPAAVSQPAAGGKTATAQYDYEAAEDNELSFPDGATITDIEFPDEDWWFGHYGGHSGLFPANYVELNG
ncbi:hypothetical protein K470DRAFT_260638 [Piedraia hortae CBS 480.64]|uniref:Actin binding protein n=1 Tax=Piedraia hortae CBS 480.64 TaxID=1314780 RepID=A0A6A7BRS6_9PEZI|nr:hypothetical protein K470DRAFT_260638 [Piedraia hortae CBS 480.64]